MESHPATLAATTGRRPTDSCPSDNDILAYLPRELSGPLAESIAAHLATCPRCQMRASTLKQRLSDLPPTGEVADRAEFGSAPASADAGSRLSDSPQTIINPLQPRTAQRLNEYELLEPIGRG